MTNPDTPSSHIVVATQTWTPLPLYVKHLTTHFSSTKCPPRGANHPRMQRRQLPPLVVTVQRQQRHNNDKNHQQTPAHLLLCMSTQCACVCLCEPQNVSNTHTPRESVRMCTLHAMLQAKGDSTQASSKTAAVAASCSTQQGTDKQQHSKRTSIECGASQQNVVTARQRGERIVRMTAGGPMLETTIVPPKPPPCSPIPPCLPPPHFATPAFCVLANCCYCYCCALPYAVVVAWQKVCLPASQPCLQKARSAVYCFFGMSTRCSPVGCWLVLRHNRQALCKRPHSHTQQQQQVLVAADDNVPGGRDCVSFSALSASLTVNVYKYCRKQTKRGKNGRHVKARCTLRAWRVTHTRLQRILNLTMPLDFLIFTAVHKKRSNAMSMHE